MNRTPGEDPAFLVPRRVRRFGTARFVGLVGVIALPAALLTFRKEVIKLWRHGLCRRSQKAHVTWSRMLRIADARLPRVRIVHPWPSQRLTL